MNKVDQYTLPKDKEKFYIEGIKLLMETKIPFLIGGGAAVREYTEAYREMKDIDIFCKAGDFLKILHIFTKHDYKTEITDERWIAKVLKGNYNIDFIFGSVNGQNSVDDTWFEKNKLTTIFGQKVKLLRPEELIWCKSYAQNRTWFEGPDIYHLILKQGKDIDWKRLLRRMEIHWEILFAHLINFRFIYPSDRHLVPNWLMEELIHRLKKQLHLPPPKDKVCRGTILSRNDYFTDITSWGYKDIT